VVLVAVTLALALVNLAPHPVAVAVVVAVNKLLRSLVLRVVVVLPTPEFFIPN
jgi:hypothetical protein